MTHHFKYFIYEKKTNQLKTFGKNYSWEDSPKHLVLKSLAETEP